MSLAGYWGGGDVTNSGGGGSEDLTIKVVNKILSATQIALPATLYTLLNYTIPAGKKFVLLSMQGSSNGDAEWNLYINGSLANKKRNWLSTHSIELDFDYPYILLPTQNVTITAKNNTKFGTTNDIDIFLYGNESNI